MLMTPSCEFTFPYEREKYESERSFELMEASENVSATTHYGFL